MINKIISRSKLAHSHSIRLLRGFHSAAESRQIVEPHKLSAQILSGYNKPGLLEKILGVFHDKSVNLFFINGRVLEKDARGMEKCQFDLSFDGAKPEVIKVIEDIFRSMGLEFKFQKPPLVDWFAMSEEDMNKLGSVVQRPADGLNLDHPGFKDELYKQRRDVFYKSTIGYKMKNPIPTVPYTEEETKLWKYIYEKVRPLHRKHAHRSFNRAIERLEKEGIFSPDRVPQMEELSSWLKSVSNWRLKPVDGILSNREFYNSLALRTFCSTMYLRHPSRPEYTPEPDIMHEYLGHVPNFADPLICDISQKLGMLSLGATDEQIAMIGAIYWFTIEFGLCKEGDTYKFYGAGPGGSSKEILHIEKMVKDHRDKIYKLDLINNPVPVKFVVQDVQPFYYAAESFEDFLKNLNEFGESFKKPFNLIYDWKTNSYQPDRAIQMKSFEETNR